MLSNLALAQQMMDEASSEDEAFDDDFNDDLFVEFQRQEANEKIWEMKKSAKFEKNARNLTFCLGFVYLNKNLLVDALETHSF